MADAITWVLGEQSAKSLRGDKMEDVIFNGSDARKPGAAAEVRLRLAGSARSAGSRRRQPRRSPALEEFHADAPERQRATAQRDQRQRQRPRRASTSSRRRSRATSRSRRRLYRSGESEYLIDGAVCRLRDVHELLMDTGLGAKAYSIIEQGKIGMILSSRPADRRQLIEEAAGITKYRSRRRAAELKLEAAQQNLVRIDDIVFEVEKQRGALKRQAAKARRYGRLREEYRRWEKVLFARRYRDLAGSIESARGQTDGRAGARGSGAGASGGGRSASWRDCASSRPRPTARVDADSRRRACPRARHQPAAAAAGIQSSADRDARRSRHGDRRRDSGPRGAPRAGARRARVAPRGRGRDRADARRGRRCDGIRQRRARARRSRRSKDSSRASRRSAAELFRSSNATMTVRHVLEHTATQHERVGEQLAPAGRRAGRCAA